MPIYVHKGFLRAKRGPPEVRLTGDATQEAAVEIPVCMFSCAGLRFITG